MSGFPTTWVLVADSGRSRLFSWTTANGELEELEDAINPDARLKEAELTSDRASSGHESHGQGQHATTPEHGAKEQSSTQFARELSYHLRSALNAQLYERLVLICPPEFLGVLRAELDKGVCQLVAEVIGLDLTRHSAEEISKRLPPLGSLG